MKLTILFISILLIGCGTIKETTTTETVGQTIPALIIHDTVSIPVELPITSDMADSIGKWYLENFCKGEVNVDKDGLRASIKFWMTTAKSKDKLLNEKENTIMQLGYEIEKKKQEIESIKTTTESKSTPGNLWILFHSWQFTIPAFILGALVVILIGRKTTLLNKIL
jgi:hypothetical protein